MAGFRSRSAFGSGASDIFCASSPEAQLLPDDEFWDRVYPQQTEEDMIEDMLAEFQRETWVIDCARCQRTVEIDEETRVDRLHDAFCDECAEEMEEVPEYDPLELPADSPY